MKRLMAPVLMITAAFSGVSARAQETKPLPDAPVPQTGNINDLPAVDISKLNLSPPAKTLDLSPPATARIDLNGSAYKPKTFDFSLPPEKKDDTALPQLPGKISRVAVFADRHMINGEQGYDLAAEVRLKERFTLIAGTPDTGYKINDTRWDKTGPAFKPEITIPGSWNTENSHMSLRPKGRGFMIGLKVKFH